MWPYAPFLSGYINVFKGSLIRLALADHLDVLAHVAGVAPDQLQGLVVGCQIGVADNVRQHAVIKAAIITRNVTEFTPRSTIGLIGAIRWHRRTSSCWRLPDNLIRQAPLVFVQPAPPPPRICQPLDELVQCGVFLH